MEPAPKELEPVLGGRQDVMKTKSIRVLQGYGRVLYIVQSGIE